MSKDGVIWETEHGPRGGDELNIIKKGVNYGWPVITYGINYIGTKITDITEKEGMEQPVWQWTPSIAVCGMSIYESDLFTKWNGNILVTALKYEYLERVVIKDNKFVSERLYMSQEAALEMLKWGQTEEYLLRLKPWANCCPIASQLAFKNYIRYE